MCKVAMDRLLSPIGGRHTAVKAWQVEQETHQAHAACPHFDADEMAGNHEAMEERQARTPLKNVGDLGTDVAGIVPDAPGLTRASGHLECLSGVTLRDTLGSQLPILGQEGRTGASLPTGLALRVALLRVGDDGSHSALLCASLAF